MSLSYIASQPNSPFTYPPPEIRPYDQGLWKPIGFPQQFWKNLLPPRPYLHQGHDTLSDVLGEVGAWQQSLYTAAVDSTHLPGHLPVTWLGNLVGRVSFVRETYLENTVVCAVFGGVVDIDVENMVFKPACQNPNQTFYHCIFMEVFFRAGFLALRLCPGGGFEDFLFSPLFGEDFRFD